MYTYYWNKSPDEAFSQDVARIWRRTTMYELLLQNLIDRQRGILVTAHHRNDSTETLLLKLLRGVHITNLVGMDIVTEPNDMPQAIMARPMLGVSKEDVQEFLTSQNLPWREDASNASSKYKRNRVRNELVPLLADIVGSEELLEKRLESLSQQSKQLRKDLMQRAEMYLRERQTNRYFPLPLDQNKLTLVAREALHSWSKQRGAVLSYDQLQRVCAQLESYPDAIQWTLQVGEGWNIVRNGASLDVVHDGDVEEALVQEQPIEWSLVEGAVDADGKDLIMIRLDKAPSDNPAFVRSTSGQVSNAPFTPSWRNNPIKVKEFLRGQKVPLHLRDQVPVVQLGGKVVAVFINGKWEVDAAAQQGNVLVKLFLRKE